MKSFLRGARKDATQIVRSGKLLKDEDAFRNIAPNEAKGYRLPTVYANNDFLLTKDAAWAGFFIPSKTWGFLDEDNRKRYFLNAKTFYDRIFPAGKDHGGHLIVSNEVYSADDWENELVARSPNAGDAFRKYVHGSRDAIEQHEFFERECYLFTRLGARGEGGGITGFIRSAFETFAVGAGLDDVQPSEKERAFWQAQSETVDDALRDSWVNALRIPRRRLEWLTRHLDTPGLPTTDTAPADEQEWGAGEWRTVLSSYTSEIDLGVEGKNRYRCVQFDAPVGAGTAYAAYLPVNHIPSGLHYSTNWIHHASTLPFPVDLSLHFEIIDPDRAEKELSRPISDAENQEAEDRDAEVRPDDITAIQQQELRQVKTRVRMQREPIAFWQAVFAVYDTDKDALRSKVTKLIRHYKDIQFTLECPRDDQRELFYQSFPGSEVLVEDWIHRTDTKYLAAAMPWLSSTVGDRADQYGIYQGYTVTRDNNGHPQRSLPMFHDLQNVVDAEGKAPVEIVSGNPGSGKTVSRGLKPVYEDALRGVTQFVWDPKGDFEPMHLYASRMFLDPAKVKWIDLSDPTASVSLDAFAIAEVDPTRNIDERQTAASDVLRALCGDYITDPQRGLIFRDLIDQAVSTVLRHEKESGVQPTMKRVLDVMGQWRRGEFGDTEILATDINDWQSCSRMLHDNLLNIEKDTFGRLLFLDPGASGSMKMARGDLIIFVAKQMRVREDNEEHTRATRIADVISGLMTDFIRSLLILRPADEVKAATFDEWHVIRRSSRAPALMDWMRRMGRSRRCMVRQMSQSAKDFDKGSVSTIWCGYCQDDDSAIASCNLLGIEPSASNKGLLMALQPGQFLHRDVHGRVGMVQIDIWDPWLLERFNTQAASKAEFLAAEAAANAGV